MKKLGILGLMKLLIRVIGTYALYQAEIVAELKVLNRHIERIYPPTKTTAPPADEPLLGDDPYTLSMAEDANLALRHELGREPSSEEILERMKVWRERRDPIAPRRDLIDAG